MNTDRKLARVVVVDDVIGHPNADALEIAVIGGWKCCVKKGEFQRNDLGLYFEVDALLPLDNPAFSFLAGRNEREYNGKRYARIKTMKLRGELSQGLLLPLHSVGIEVAKEGCDFTSSLGVVKYEPTVPAVLSGAAKGGFPSFIPKTDQERVQNIKSEYVKCVNNKESFEVTYKLDGSSFTAYVNLDEDGKPYTGVCSRNLELKIDGNENNLFIQTFKKYHLAGILDMWVKIGNQPIAIQGEMVGPGIQGNFEGLDDVKLYVYNVFDIQEQKYLLPTQTRDVVAKLGLDYVPIYLEDCLLSESLDDIITLADGESGLNGKYREGFVFKSNERDFSFKVISNSYLLKEK